MAGDEICLQEKQTKNYFQYILKLYFLSKLIHSDICEMNSVVTNDDKRYCITYVNDKMKYCHVYLFRTKDITSRYKG